MSNDIELDQCLRAVSNPVRREILSLLKHPNENFVPNDHLPNEEGICVASIILRMKLAQSTISKHLAILHGAKLLASKSVGQWTYFKRNEQAIRQFALLLKQEL